MDGQWIGEYAGSNHGTIIIDLDHCGSHFRGTATVFDASGLPGSLVKLHTPDCGSKHHLTNLSITPLDPQTANVSDASELVQRFIAEGLELRLPTRVDATLNLEGDRLNVEWCTDLQTTGKASIARSLASTASNITPNPDVRCWDEFKRRMVDLEPLRYIFRGQPSTWRLRTAFHRTRRKDVYEFMQHYIPRLHRVLSGQTRHHFDLMDSWQNSAFWNLVQHHGYPTPLLDWSYSPFVAAFFAYRNKIHDDAVSPSVRIFMFDRTSWCKDFNQLGKIAPAQPHFTILESLALENPRLVPQQALSTVTNIDDIESYLRSREIEQSKSYLQAFDLPASEKVSTLNELAMMGISAGSLFPGLDGICEEWRYRLFGYD